MSFLSATLISAALLGAGPEVAPCGLFSTPVPLSAEGNLPVESVLTGCELQSGADAEAHCEDEEGGWCPWGDEGDECEEPCCWDRHLMNSCIGPGDFYPHYPYFPVYHGYYYFRPYNFEHVSRDAAMAAQMGGDPRAPYSVEFLKTYFPPAPIEPIPASTMRTQLPNLEDLLRPEPLILPHPPLIPETPSTPVHPNVIPAPAPDQPVNPAELRGPAPVLDENL